MKYLKLKKFFFSLKKPFGKVKYIIPKLNLVDAARVLWWYEVVCAFYTAAHFSHTKRTLQFIYTGCTATTAAYMNSSFDYAGAGVFIYCI